MHTKKDMHPADIVAAFKKQNLSLAQVSRLHGLSSGTLANALIRPWPKVKLIIALYLGIHPSEIWPSRYYGEQGNLIKRKLLLRRNNSKPEKPLCYKKPPGAVNRFLLGI